MEKKKGDEEGGREKKIEEMKKNWMKKGKRERKGNRNMRKRR